MSEDLFYEKRNAALRQQLEQATRERDAISETLTIISTDMEQLRKERDEARANEMHFSTGAELAALRTERDTLLAASKSGPYCTVNAEVWFKMRARIAELEQAQTDLVAKVEGSLADSKSMAAQHAAYGGMLYGKYSGRIEAFKELTAALTATAPVDDM